MKGRNQYLGLMSRRRRLSLLVVTITDIVCVWRCSPGHDDLNLFSSTSTSSTSTSGIKLFIALNPRVLWVAGWVAHTRGGGGVVTLTLPLYDGSRPGWTDSLDFKLNRKTRSQPSGFEVYTIHEKMPPSQSGLTVVNCCINMLDCRSYLAGNNIWSSAWHKSIWWNDKSGEASQ